MDIPSKSMRSGTDCFGKLENEEGITDFLIDWSKGNESMSTTIRMIPRKKTVCEPKVVPTFSPNPLKLLGDVL
jgi:hypothetical protein